MTEPIEALTPSPIHNPGEQTGQIPTVNGIPNKKAPQSVAARFPRNGNQGNGILDRNASQQAMVMATQAKGEINTVSAEPLGRHIDVLV